MENKTLLGKVVDEWKEANKFFLVHTPEVIEKLEISYERNLKPINSMDAASLAAHGLMREGLIHTYPAKSVIRMMSKEFDFIEGQMYTKEMHNGEIQIILVIPEIEGNIDAVKRAIDRLGWYFSTKEQTVHKGWVRLYFGKKFQVELNKEIREKYDRLYHITPVYYADKIRHIGISPKSKNHLFKYPDRCHFIYGRHTMSEFVNFAKMLYNEDTNPRNEGKYKIFILDVDKIPNNVKLYYGPAFTYGVFTPNNVPPTAIVGSIDVDLRNIDDSFYYE